MEVQSQDTSADLDQRLRASMSPDSYDERSLSHRSVSVRTSSPEARARPAHLVPEPADRQEFMAGPTTTTLATTHGHHEPKPMFQQLHSTSAVPRDVGTRDDGQATRNPVGTRSTSSLSFDQNAAIAPLDQDPAQRRRSSPPLLQDYGSWLRSSSAGPGKPQSDSVQVPSAQEPHQLFVSPPLPCTTLGAVQEEIDEVGDLPYRQFWDKDTNRKTLRPTQSCSKLGTVREHDPYSSEVGNSSGNAWKRSYLPATTCNDHNHATSPSLLPSQTCWKPPRLPRPSQPLRTARSHGELYSAGRDTAPSSIFGPKDYGTPPVQPLSRHPFFGDHSTGSHHRSLRRPASSNDIRADRKVTMSSRLQSDLSTRPATSTAAGMLFPTSQSAPLQPYSTPNSFDASPWCNSVATSKSEVDPFGRPVSATLPSHAYQGIRTQSTVPFGNQVDSAVPHLPNGGGVSEAYAQVRPWASREQAPGHAQQRAATLDQSHPGYGTRQTWHGRELSDLYQAYQQPIPDHSFTRHNAPEPMPCGPEPTVQDVRQRFMGPDRRRSTQGLLLDPELQALSVRHK